MQVRLQFRTRGFSKDYISDLKLSTASVRHSEFKTCSQSGFCKRNRELAGNAASSEAKSSPYTLDPKSLHFDNGLLTGIVIKDIGTQEAVRLPISVAFLEIGAVRVSIDEERRQNEDVMLRHGSQAQKRRYSEAEKWALSGNLTLCKQSVLVEDELPMHGLTRVRHGNNDQLQTVIYHSPLSIDIERNGRLEVQLNTRGFLNLEHWREHGARAESLDSNKDTWWEESFGGTTDSKPRGPESVGLDVSFPAYQHVYGIPEHASSLSLKVTTGVGEGAYSEPYRLYNTDVFEYELDSPMTLYGSIPFMQAHRTDSTAGVLWLNGAETWVDIEKTNAGTQTHWMSEAGVLDLFVFLGDTPKQVLADYTAVTGTTQMPQEFAVAYHQCRWNYVTDEDVIGVADSLDRFGIPFDAMWLDIEWADEKKYFEWDPLSFPDPGRMHAHLDRLGRRQIIVLDSHIKLDKNYNIMHQVMQQDLAVKTKTSKELFTGKCWPGSSYWVDHFNPHAVTWWKSLFPYDAFQGTFSNTFLWNDMGEPSVMDGPEATMPRDNIHYGGWEHRDLHNINGLTFHEATYEALLSRSEEEVSTPRRPFVLTRSFFVGSQRTSMAWTGDNRCSWDHLAASIPMLLTNGISGFPAIGADVPGYFGDSSPELIARWYQAGAFYPFFRAHGHLDTKRREPYLIAEPHRSVMISAVRLRYQLMPSWYTAFRHAAIAGEPIIRPNYYVHPTDEDGFAIEDQFYLGSTGLLVRPVTEEGETTADLYLPDDQPYYDYSDFTVYVGKGRHLVPAPLEKIPILMRSGHIFPRRDRPRRSTALMRHDPVALIVVLGMEKSAPGGTSAQGEIYLDDGETFQYRQGAQIHRQFVFDSHTSTLRSEDVGLNGETTLEFLKKMERITVGKIILVGNPVAWEAKRSVTLREEDGLTRDLELQTHSGTGAQANWAVVRNPAVGIGKSWEISF